MSSNETGHHSDVVSNGGTGEPRIFDLGISVGLHTLIPPMHSLKVDPGFSIQVLRRHEDPGGEGQVVRAIHMRLHVGTHVDAPEHYMQGGSQILDLPIDTFVGPALIADVSRSATDYPIDAEVLRHAVPGDSVRGTRLLIRTGWNVNFSSDSWRDGSPFLTEDAVDWIVDQGVRLLGVDFVHSKDGPNATERYYLTRTMCAAGIPVLTNIQLHHVDVPQGFLIAAPMSIEGVEAAGVRPILLGGAWPN